MGRLSQFAKETTTYAANARGNGYFWDAPRFNTDSEDIIKRRLNSDPKGNGKTYTVDTFAMMATKFKGIKGGAMQGSIVVRDLFGNNHASIYAATHYSTHNTIHAEDNLLHEVIKYFQNDRGLSTAKVVLYTTMSPCKNCSDNLKGWWENAKKAIKCEDAVLRFRFSRYYCAGDGAQGNFQFDNKNRAREKYEKIMKNDPSIRIEQM
jgi:hypothetical protein